MNTRDLSIGYGDQPVCVPVTFDLLPDRILAPIGVNETGESTTLRTCCGLLCPLSGQIHVLGRVSDPRLGAQRTTFITDLGWESPFPTLTIVEHLRMVCFGHGVVETDKRVGDLLEDLELQQLARRLPEELSSEQRHRLTLASVPVRPRRLLVLDEPGQRLDRVIRLFLVDMLVEECGADGGVLMVSHDLEIVEEVAISVLPVGHSTRMLSVDDSVRAIEEGLR